MAEFFPGYLLRGALLGTVILGVGGRLAMVVFSLIVGLPLGLTLRGTAAVVVTGALYGLPGGAVCWVLDRYTRLGAVPRAAVSGTLLLLGIAAVSIPYNQAGAALERPGLTAGLFLPLTIAFAAAIQRPRVTPTTSMETR